MHGYLPFPPKTGKGEGGTKDPVVLALMVKPSASEDEVYEEGPDEILAYDWTLKNLGSASCRMTALLLNNDKEAGFRENNIVLALDGQQLEANGGNTLSGTFRIPSLEEAEEEALPEETEEEALPEETEEAAETLLEGEEQTETYSAAEEETEESLTAEEETEEAPLLVADEETPMYFCAIVTDEEGAVWCSNVCEF